MYSLYILLTTPYHYCRAKGVSLPLTLYRLEMRASLKKVFASSGVQEEPSPRWGHVSVAVGGRLHLWGGRTRDFVDAKGRNKLASSLHTFHPYLEAWDSRALRGDPPGGLYFAAGSAIGQDIYLYGGEDDKHYYGTLYRLDTEKLEWSEVEAEGEFPMRKSGGGIVTYMGQLVLFGGFGVSSGFTQSGAEYVKGDKRRDGGGWTNELHVFNFKEGKWSSPAVSGTRPPPCNAFSFTMMDDHRAVLFAGRQQKERTNDVYILDLARMHWTKLEPPKGEPCPVGRSCHTAVCLGVGSASPQLLVMGGVGDGDGRSVLQDMWLLDLRSARWREISISESHSWKSHSATAFQLGVGLMEVVVFGGDPEGTQSGKHKKDNTTILRFECQKCNSADVVASERWQLTNVADTSVFGTKERIGEKLAKMNFSMEDTLSAALRKEYDRRVHEAEERARESERRAEVSEERLLALEQRLLESEARSQGLEERAQSSVRTLQELEDKIKDLTVSNVRQWLVKPEEVHLTEEKLGGGGWGEVQVAVFRGTRVAAKVLYSDLRSAYYQDVFVREMSMAARIRHPNLVQFIGATSEGEMIILTELLPTSLRSHLEVNQKYSSLFVHSVALDTARGLNYLHLMQPDPIIHRDISSANVLLEPLASNRWRAKITDYGSVNFQRHLKTVGPGSPAYAAPEAVDPSSQSPKMDVFSLGVLLIEMCACRFPDASARETLVASIRDRVWVELIEKCTCKDKEERLSAAQVIVELDKLSG